MFQQMLVDRILVACASFSRCFRGELDRSGTTPETREKIALIFDNALICYGNEKRGDSTTEAVIRQLRPKVRQWLS